MSLTLEQSPVTLRDGEGDRIAFGGVEIIFKSPVGEGDGWTVLDYRLPARQFGAVLHYHNFLIESFYVLEGEILFRIGDEETTLGPGGFAFVPPRTAHSFANHTDAPARMLAHASSGDHKRFLCELFAMIQQEPVWPPKDPGEDQGFREAVRHGLPSLNAKLGIMCRSIKILRRREAPATSDEVGAAALQFVRKISGMRKPSKANQAAFDRAVLEISASSTRLLQALGLPAPPQLTSEESTGTARPHSHLA